MVEIKPDAEQRYANTLKWIRHIAAMHWFGGAFDPEHMRDIANIASDGLDLSHEPLPDYDSSMAKAREEAQEMADRLGFGLLDEENDER